MDLVSWFLGIVGFWIPLPFDQILERSRPPKVSVIDDFLNFVFFFSLDKVWGWSRIIWSVGRRFTIRR